MIYFSIDTNKKQNGQTAPSFNEHQNTLINNVPTPNNDVHIKYQKNNIDQNNNTTTLHNPAPTTNNNTRAVTINWSPKAVREFKYNLLLNKFDEGYPETFTYAICPQKLATVFSLGSSRHISVTQNVTTSYPKNHHRLSVIENNNNDIFKCGDESGDESGDETFAPCTLSCPSGTFADPVSCICVSNPPLCVPLTPEPCTPTLEFTDLKNTIQGYAFYVSDPKTYTYNSGFMSVNPAPYTVPIPDIGDMKPSCFGGHACNRTLFQPALIVDDKKILANKTINLNNNIDIRSLVYNPTIKPSGSLLTPKEAYPHAPLAEFEQQRIDRYNEFLTEMGPNGFSNSIGWGDATRIYDRSDTFTFTLPDPSVLVNASLTLDCKLAYCHDSVTFIVLVGERLDTNEKVLLFASCVAPSSVDVGKLIGVIDCPDGPPDPCYGYNTTSSINIIP